MTWYNQETFNGKLAHLEQTRCATLPLMPTWGTLSYPDAEIADPYRHYLAIAKTHLLAMCAQVGLLPPNISLYVVQVRHELLSAYVPAIHAVAEGGTDKPLDAQSLEWLAHFSVGLDNWSDAGFYEPTEFIDGDETLGIGHEISVADPTDSARLAILQLQSKGRAEEAANVRLSLRDSRIREVLATTPMVATHPV